MIMFPDTCPACSAEVHSATEETAAVDAEREYYCGCIIYRERDGTLASLHTCPVATRTALDKLNAADLPHPPSTGGVG